MAKKLTILLLLALGLNLLVLPIVWAHHAFVTGLNPFLEFVCAVLTLLLLVLFCIFGGKHFINYIRRNLDISPSLLFVLGAIILATAYLVDGLLFGDSALETYSSSSNGGTHFYTRLLFVVLFIALAVAYRYFPVIAHRSLNPKLGYVHFWITLACAYMIVYPIHYDEMAGMPRRYLSYGAPPELHRYTFNDTMAFILLAAQGLFLINLLNSTRRTHDL